MTKTELIWAHQSCEDSGDMLRFEFRILRIRAYFGFGASDFEFIKKVMSYIIMTLHQDTSLNDLAPPTRKRLTARIEPDRKGHIEKLRHRRLSMNCQRIPRYWFLGIALPILIQILGSNALSFAEGREIPREEQVSFGGSIILRDGGLIRVVEFLSPLKDNYIQGEYEGRVVKIKASDLKEILLLDVGCGYGWYFHGPQWKGRMRITYRSGKGLEISSADFCAYNLQDGEFQYKVYNEALGKNETRQIMTTRIAMILIRDAEEQGMRSYKRRNAVWAGSVIH